jgi:hypothetical protein
MMVGKITAYGHGLAMWWNLKIVSPEPRHNKNTKDEANKQTACSGSYFSCLLYLF